MRHAALFIFALSLVHPVSAQINPSSEFILGDTTSRLEITDFFITQNGTVYSTGQYVNDSIALYISAVSPSGKKIFELFRRKGFEEKGRYIRPYDKDHFLVCGHSEDKTGTFNVRLLMLTNSGVVVWDTTYGDDGKGTMEMPNDLAVDSKGNIVIGGISQFSEIKYLLLKFSPAGQLLWSRTSVPFETGTFNVHDIILDAEDNIYGLTNNTFIPDSSHGTVFRWDPMGNVVWSKSFNLSSYEERGVNLALTGDTLYAAGSPWTNGENSTAVTIVALGAANGQLISYRTIPLFSIQQGIRDLQLLSGGKIALLDESYIPPNHRLYTFVLSPSLATLYLDSMLAGSPAKGSITEMSDSSFDVIRYGGELSRIRYTVKENSVSPISIRQYANGGRMIELIGDAPPFFAAMSRISGTNSDRVHAAFYSSPPLASPARRNESPSSPELLSGFPNPFNPSATIAFQVLRRSHVTITAYDPLGRVVEQLVSQEMDAGTYFRRWDAQGLSSGTYYIRLQSNGAESVIPMVLLR